jgi:nascent polypeptide-associated complex subunit alpha
MMPGINPRQMRQAMKRMGIQQEDLEVKEIIMKLEDKELIFKNPQVAKVNMMGQETYQVVGEATERKAEDKISEEDIKTVMQQAKVSKKEAEKALKESNGDLAEAILKLQ